MALVVCLVFGCCFLFLENRRLEGLLASGCRGGCRVCSLRGSPSFGDVFGLRPMDFGLEEFERKMAVLAARMNDLESILGVLGSRPSEKQGGTTAREKARKRSGNRSRNASKTTTPAAGDGAREEKKEPSPGGVQEK